MSVGAVRAQSSAYMRTPDDAYIRDSRTSAAVVTSGVQAKDDYRLPRTACGKK